MQFGRSILKINWYEQVQSENTQLKILCMFHAHVVVKTSNLVISLRPYAEYRKNPS